MEDDFSGGGWRIIRPRPELLATWTPIDPLIPEADWFWHSLQRFCVPDCCGLAAYDFSAESVAWACGWGTVRPEGTDWRDENPGATEPLTAALREAARQIRDLDANAVSARLFNDILTPESYASLLEDLADKTEPT